MAQRPKSRKVRSPAGKPRRPGEDGEPDSPTGVVKSPEEEVKRLVLACQALMEAPPGQFDREEAMRLKMELDALIAAVQHAQKATDTEYFDWLEMNIPELFDIKGRPKWIESEKVTSKDKALLDNFDQKLNRNTAANAGKKRGASKKTYGDLADESGGEDPETVKRRVMRARKRQKALQETIQDILGIDALAKTDGTNAVPPKEYERRREKLLKAFRSVLRTK